jgi:iron complex outermembrane receptor protein
MKSSLLFAATSVLALSTAAVAAAQTAPQPAGATAGAPQATPAAPAATTGLQELVVTARRTEERLQDVPIAITAMTAKDLQQHSVREISEIQKTTPGLYVSSIASSARPKFVLRGQTEADSRLTTDSSVGVYVDGVNIPRDYGLRSSFVDIAQVEVLKGPQGTLFGRNTTGGALNITTQHPTFNFGGYVDALYGSYNNRQLTGAINIPIIQDRLAVRLVAQDIKRDGYGHDLLGRPVNDDDVISGRFEANAVLTSNVHFLLEADYMRQNTHGSSNPIVLDQMMLNGNGATKALGEIAAELGLNPNSAADRLTAYNAWKSYANRYAAGDRYDDFTTLPLFDKVTAKGTSGTFNIDLRGYTLKSITAYRYVSDSKLQDLDGTPFNLQETGGGTQDGVFSQEFQLISPQDQRLAWQVGAFYNREVGEDLFISNSNNAVASASDASVTDVGIINTSKALYGQANFKITDTVRFTGGLRYTQDTRAIDSHNRTDPAYAIPADPSSVVGKCSLLSPALGGPSFPNCSYNASVTYSAWTYLLSLDWRPKEGLMFYTSTSRGYRAGGWTEQANSAVITSQAQLAADFTPFAPETVTNYEVGIKSDWFERRLRIDAAAYYQDYDNIQQQIRDFIDNIPVTLIRNAAKAKIYGGELAVTARPISPLELDAGVGYVHAKYDSFFAKDASGNTLNLSSQKFPLPEWQANFGGAYTWPLHEGDLVLTANYAWIDSVPLQPGAPTVSSVTQPAYGLLDARLAWQINRYDLNVAVFGKNLADTRYWTGATNLEGAGWNIAFPGDPRTFGVQVRKTF